MHVNKLDHTIMGEGMKIVPENWIRSYDHFCLRSLLLLEWCTYYCTLMKSTLVQPQPRIIYVWPQPLLTDGFGSWAKKRGKSCQSLVGRPKKCPPCFTRSGLFCHRLRFCMESKRRVNHKTLWSWYKREWVFSCPAKPNCAQKGTKVKRSQLTEL